MTFTSTPRPAGAARPGRRRGALGPTIAVLVALGVLLMITAQLWTEVLWYDQLGFVEILRTEWVTRAALFAAGFLVMAAAVFAALSVAYRTRPIYAPSTPEQASLDQYREMIEPLRRLVMLAAPAVLGFFAGAAASAQWETVLLLLNGGEVGILDPQFQMDLSFYLFTLPAIRFIVSFLMAVAVIAGIAGLATQYLYGGLRVGGGSDERTTPAARIQLGSTAVVIMLLIAANYWLDRYSLMSEGGDLIQGASYADVNAVLPSKAILTGVAVLVAILFAVAAIRGTWRLPVIGVGLMVVSAVAIGGIYPAAVQRFQVAPNEQVAEAEYIQRNIDATRTAFGLDDIEVTPYNATLEAEAGALREDTETTASIRLLDPAIVSPSFRQLQQNKQYYDFPNTLAVDRYEIDGENRDTVIAVRELNLNGLGQDQRTWVNDHTVYTHGFGVVAAYGNTTAADGRPAFYQGGIPSTGSLGDYEPRIYFGQSVPSYSIVGAPEDAEPWELDFPDDDAPGGQVNTSFPTDEVDAGPSIGNLFNKVLFALKFGSEQILFSDRVTPESQILFDRDPRDRVGKVAPYLTLDTRVYPAVVDERVVWIVDGYTTSDQYPYADSRALEEVTTDSLTGQGPIAALAPAEVNYIRNSVKATVDAYSGEVTLYTWDDEDPVLAAWQEIFPSSLEPMSEISGDLMSHLRYPEDLFKVQRNLLAEYHVETAAEYYSGQDFWRNPEDPVEENRQQPPYYLTLQMPTQDEPVFSLTSTFIPGGNTNRNVLTGFLAVDAEPGDTAGEKREGYGKLRLLELPRDSTVPGPGQVQNNFRSNPEVSQSLNVLQLGNSSVLSGNLLTLPVGGGLLYVQPVYVQSSVGTQFPLLQRVLVSFGEEIGFAETLEEALDQVFEGDAGVDAPEPGEVDEDIPDAPVDGFDPLPGTDENQNPPDPDDVPADPTPAPTTAPVDPGTLDPAGRLDAALQEARQALLDGEAALAEGDFAAYGEAQDRLQQALEAAIAAEQEAAE